MTLGAIVIPIFGVIVGCIGLLIAWRFVKGLPDESEEAPRKDP